MAEPMYGTASTVPNWILLEQSGPWGYRAVLENRAPAGVARALWRLAARLGVRLILIRRPGRREVDEHHCYLAHTGPDAPWMERLTLTAPEGLLDVDLTPLAEGHPPGVGRRIDGPLFLVCTNGRRDPCCAERGRPVAAALVPDFGDDVWECSHIGGDRFAGNLVCFPHGVYFGRVDADAAPVVARTYSEGRLALDFLRGRSCFPFDVQAAETLVRRRMGLVGIDQLHLEERAEEEGGRVRVTFSAAEGPVTVVMRVRLGSPRPLTCHAEQSSPPRVYELVGD